MGKKPQHIFKHFEVHSHVLCGFIHSFLLLFICIFRKYFLNGKCLRHTAMALTDTVPVLMMFTASQLLSSHWCRI